VLLDAGVDERGVEDGERVDVQGPADDAAGGVSLCPKPDQRTAAAYGPVMDRFADIK